jgi:hypothetical protein
MSRFGTFGGCFTHRKWLHWGIGVQCVAVHGFRQELEDLDMRQGVRMSSGARASLPIVLDPQ